MPSLTLFPFRSGGASFAVVALVVLLVASGCKNSAADGSGGGGGSGSSSTSTGQGGGAPSAAELAAGVDAGDSVTSVAEMLTIADLMFKFDPDLHPDSTAASNSTTIRQNATTQTAGCANVKLSQGPDLTVDFGPAPGCTLQGGAVVSGVLGVAVSKVDATSTLTVDLTFTSLVVNGITFNGTSSFATTTGSTFSVTLALDVQSGTKASTLDGTLSVTGSPGSISVSGSLSTAAGPATITNVTLSQGACYASGGTVSVMNAMLGNPTVTFDASTPSTGKATLTVQTPQGKSLPPTTITLPPYGTCPHA